MASYLQLITPLLAEFQQEHGATVTLFDVHGNCIAHRGGGVDLCRRLKKRSALHCECDRCDRFARARVFQCKGVYEYTCHAGFREAAVPVFSDRRRYAGCLMMGKICLEEEWERTLAAVRALVARNGLDEEAALAEFRALPRLNETQYRKAVASLIKLAEKLGGELHRLESGRNCLTSLQDERVLKAIRLIDESDERMTCEKLRRALGMNRRSFVRLFKKQCGERPGEFIAGRNLVKAEELLRNTDMSVWEIALELGYSYRAFIGFFKRKYGITPMEFRTLGYLSLTFRNDPRSPF